MNAADLDRLAALAEAATPGPWRTDENDAHVLVREAATSEIVAGDIETYADAAFIAACDPATVTALIERIRELESRGYQPDRPGSLSFMQPSDSVDEMQSRGNS